MADCITYATNRKIATAFPRWGRGGTGPQIVGRPPNLAPPQIAAMSPNLAVLLTHCGQLILKKISKLDAATGCQILRLKCTKFDFRWGLRRFRGRVLTPLLLSLWRNSHGSSGVIATTAAAAAEYSANSDGARVADGSSAGRREQRAPKARALQRDRARGEAASVLQL